MAKKLVLPGEFIGTCEEFAAGKGLYEENGSLYAMQLGILEINKETLVVSIKPYNPPTVLNVNDIVIGTVSDIKSTVVSVDIHMLEGKRRSIASETQASLHVSKISNWYVHDIWHEFRVSDIIRAKVIQVKPSVQLTTASPSLGVIRALCFRCRIVLKRRQKTGNTLFCPACERVELRKIAASYGKYNLLG